MAKKKAIAKERKAKKKTEKPRKKPEARPIKRNVRIPKPVPAPATAPAPKPTPPPPIPVSEKRNVSRDQPQLVLRAEALFSAVSWWHRSLIEQAVIDMTSCRAFSDLDPQIRGQVHSSLRVLLERIRQEGQRMWCIEAAQGIKNRMKQIEWIR